MQRRCRGGLRAYGRSLGTAFQLVDDLLDYEARHSELGKNVGDDLREGKPTPLLVAMERGTPRARADPARHPTRRGRRLAEIVEIVRRTGADHRRDARAASQQAEQQRQLERLPVSEVPRGSARILCSVGGTVFVDRAWISEWARDQRCSRHRDRNRGVA